MTPEQQAEIDYLREERLGILLDGRREPTAQEFTQAHQEALQRVSESARYPHPRNK